MSLLLDLLLPSRCLACAAPDDRALCGPCRESLEDDGDGHELLPGVVAAAPFVYADPLAAAIKRVKTDAMQEGARRLADLLAPHLPTGSPRTWVPATRQRARRRGLDLPAHLAGPGASCMLAAIPGRADQGGLDAASRRRSAVGAFRALGPVPASIVLVDDVRATGATLLAAAIALRSAGARRIVAVSLAASPGPPSAAPGSASGRW